MTNSSLKTVNDPHQVMEQNIKTSPALTLGQIVTVVVLPISFLVLICAIGLARILRANAGAAMENIALWHQRDISHSSVERFIGPDSFGILHFMLERMSNVMQGLIVDTDRMLDRVNETCPYWRSQMDMLELIKDGVSRKEAHDRIQNGEKVLMLSDEKLIGYHTRHVNKIFKRIR